MSNKDYLRALAVELADIDRKDKIKFKLITRYRGKVSSRLKKDAKNMINLATAMLQQRAANKAASPYYEFDQPIWYQTAEEARRMFMTMGSR